MPGKQVPVRVSERLHALGRRAKRMRVGSLGIINVTADEDVTNAVFLGVCAKSLDGRAKLAVLLFFF